MFYELERLHIPRRKTGKRGNVKHELQHQGHWINQCSLVIHEHFLIALSSSLKESESPDDLLKGSVTYKQNPATQYFWLSLTEVNALAAFPSALPFQRKNLPVDTKSLLPLEKWLSQTDYVQILACQFTRALRQVASPYCE